MSLVDLFQTHGELGLSEVVRLSGFPKATVYRLLSALEEHEFLSRTPDRSYRLGLRFLRLGALVAEGLDVRRFALPHMQRLRDQTGQSVQLVVIDGNEGVYAERLEGTTPVRLYIAIGRRAPLYAGASTRLLFSFCSPERQAEILAGTQPVQHTATTITDPKDLMVMAYETRALGWTVSLGELQPGSAEMAAPIFGAAGTVVAALSIAGPDQLYTPEHVQEYLPPLQAAAHAVSSDMGYQSEWRGNRP
ncbi:MAG TPA: IclR family transcriptional regulator [Symbiobacteriaceae bacterium]